MRLGSWIQLSYSGMITALFNRRDPLVGSIILTDKCNLSCKHCAVSNLNGTVYDYSSIRADMQTMYSAGVRILFFYGGEPFMWHDHDFSLRDLAREARQMGFLLVNIVTNGTFELDVPEADLILVSLDGGKGNHNKIRGETYDTIVANIRNSAADNICLYMAINQINKNDIELLCEVARSLPSVRAVSFNFHTPYPGVEHLQLTQDEKQDCCNRIVRLMDEGFPILNLRSAFPYIVDNSFKTPCYQCIVMENGRQWTCGRCLEIPGLCAQCGYFFAAELSLVFRLHLKVVVDLVKTYLRHM